MRFPVDDPESCDGQDALQQVWGYDHPSIWYGFPFIKRTQA